MTNWADGVTKEDVLLLQSLLEQRARRRGEEFTLSSGKKSSFYFNAKPVTASAQGFALVGRIVGQIVRNLEAHCVGGLEIGAVPIALAAACETAQQGDEVPCFIVRVQRKEHGTNDQIAASYGYHEPLANGQARSRVVIVDDVVTTGKSVDSAINAVVEDGKQVIAVLSLVTRPEDGGVSAMRERFASMVAADYLSVFDCDLEGNLRPLVLEYAAASV